MRTASKPSLVAGLLFLAIGVGIIAIASGYRVGTAANMGPGYFPLLLGGVLVLLGGFIAVGSLRSSEGEALETESLRPLLLVCGSVVLFAAILEQAGLMLTVVLVTLCSSLASPRFSLRRACASSAALAAFCYVVFIAGLNLRIPAWPQF